MKMSGLAPILVKDAIRIKENEVVEVTLTGEKTYFDFLDEFTLEISKLGAFPTIRLHTPSYRRRFLLEVPEKYLKRTPPQTLKWIKDVHRHVMIMAEMPDANLADIAPRKTRVALEARRPIIDQIKQATVSRIHLPTSELAAFYKVPEDIFKTSVINSLNVDYDLLRKLCKKVSEMLKQAKNKVRLITGDSFQLEFKINGRQCINEDGSRELPAGSVFLAPVEHSVNGKILLDGVVYQGKMIKNLVLEFENGHIVSSSAEQNHNLFLQRLKSSYGDKEIFGGFGVGLNNGIEEPIGSEPVDVRAYGTIHIMIGSNLIFGGENFSDLSWCLINTEPTVYVDTLKLLDKGILSGKAAV